MLCRPDVRVVYNEHLVAIGKLETMANAKKFIGIVWGHLDFEELTFTLFAANGEKIVVHACSYDLKWHQ